MDSGQRAAGISPPREKKKKTRARHKPPPTPKKKSRARRSTMRGHKEERTGRHDLDARGHGAREGDLVDVGVVGQRPAHLRPAREDVEDAGGHAVGVGGLMGGTGMSASF